MCQCEKLNFFVLKEKQLKKKRKRGKDIIQNFKIENKAFFSFLELWVLKFVFVFRCTKAYIHLFVGLVGLE
jgi:hypothetical protein